MDAKREKILIQLMTSWLVFHPQAFKDVIAYCEQAGHGFTKEEIYRILHVSDDVDE